MFKKMLGLSLIFLIVITLTQSCDTTEPKIVANISIQELDVAVRETYIHLSFKSEKDRKLSLFRNGNSIFDFNCSSKDTIITDSALTQNTYYKYRVSEYDNNDFVFESNELNITTLQPTKHDFNWQTYSFETQSQSTLSDIFVINTNDVWVVGEFYFDSDVAYGFIHWDGNEWTHFRLFSKVPPTNYQSNIHPTGVYAFDSKNIWFSAGSVFHWDGDTLTPFWLSKFDGNLKSIFEEGQFARKIWGDKKSKVLYVSGDKGALAVYKNDTWSRITTDTDSDILDLWGFENPITEDTEVICATTKFSISDNNMIKITKNNNIEIIPWDQPKFLFSLWTNKGFPIFAGGNRYYLNSTQKWEPIDLNEEFTPYEIRGYSLNNIFMSGSNSKVFHFNGINWRNVSNNINSKTNLTKISVRENIVVIGGENNGIISIHITQ